MGYQYQPTYTYPVSTSNDHYSGGYLEPVPVTLPSMMHFHDVMVKREDEHTMSPFNMSYQPLPAIDIQASHRYDDSNPHEVEPGRNNGSPLSNGFFFGSDSSTLAFIRALVYRFRIWISVSHNTTLDASVAANAAPVSDMKIR